MPKQWTKEEIQQIIAAALADWGAGHVGDFAAKQVERGVPTAVVERTLKSRATLICRYTDHERPRYGFWHPETRLFIAWQPAEAGYQSQLKSCFYREDGREYMEERENFQPVRWK